MSTVARSSSTRVLTAEERLRERARRLAEPPVTPAAAIPRRPVVRFSLAGETHAIDLHHVVEVLPLRGLTPLPGAPDVYRGVSYVRGRILPILDGRRLLSLPEGDPEPGGQIVHLTLGRLDLGLLVDGEVMIDAVPRDGLVRARPGAADGDGGLIEGVTADHVVLIDAGRIAADPRIQAKPPNPAEPRRPSGLGPSPATSTPASPSP